MRRGNRSRLTLMLPDVPLGLYFGIEPPSMLWFQIGETGSNLRDKASEQAVGQPAVKPRDGPRHRRR